MDYEVLWEASDGMQTFERKKTKQSGYTMTTHLPMTDTSSFRGSGVIRGRNKGKDEQCPSPSSAHSDHPSNWGYFQTGLKFPEIHPSNWGYFQTGLKFPEMWPPLWSGHSSIEATLNCLKVCFLAMCSSMPEVRPTPLNQGHFDRSQRLEGAHNESYAIAIGTYLSPFTLSLLFLYLFSFPPPLHPLTLHISPPENPVLDIDGCRWRHLPVTIAY